MTTIFDLTQASAPLQLKGPNGDLLPITLRVQGQAVATVKQKGMEASVFLMGVDKNAKHEVVMSSLTKAEKAVCEQAAYAIVGWDNDEMMGGPYTPDYAMKLMKDDKLVWIRKQVNDFIQDQTNFFRDKPAVVDPDTEVAVGTE